MKPVLVTGGASYIGSHTVQELNKEGVSVVVLDNLTTGHRDAVRAQHFYEGDIADTALVEYIIKKHQIQSLIHFAAKSLVSESLAKPELYFYENTVKSFVFLEAVTRRVHRWMAVWAKTTVQRLTSFLWFYKRRWGCIINGVMILIIVILSLKNIF